MQAKFKKLFSSTTPENIQSDLTIIQSKVNFCQNVNLKKFLILFEEISNKFKIQKKSFNWKECFESDNENHFCSEKLIKVLEQYPEKANSIIKILNGTHYTYLNPGQFLIHIIEILGFTIDPQFDRDNIVGQYGYEILKTEMYFYILFNFIDI
jgi:hypothetical protein